MAGFEVTTEANPQLRQVLEKLASVKSDTDSLRSIGSNLFESLDLLGQLNQAF